MVFSDVRDVGPEGIIKTDPSHELDIELDFEGLERLG